MRVLLVNPPVNSSKWGKYHTLMEPMPVIGLAYLGAVLEKNGHSVWIIDDFVYNYTPEIILEKIKRFSPHIVGLSVLTPSVNFSLRLAEKIRAADRNIKILAGNVHPTVLPEEFLATGNFDAVIRGEGEKTLPEAIAKIGAGQSLSSIEGLSYVEGGRIFHNPGRPIIEDLDSLPFPAWHLLPYRRYGLFPFADIKKPILTLLSSRGCPFNCSFCSLSYMGRAYRMRTPGNICDEMEYLITKFKARQIGFVDPIFPLNEKHAVELCNEMIKRNINKKIVWTTETKIDILNENIIKSLKEAGCRRLIFGLESGSEDILGGVGKNINFSESKRIIRLMKKYGLESIGLFMMGMPGENEETIKETFRYARELDVDFAKFAVMVPFPGSELHTSLGRNNKIRTGDWDNYTTFNPVPANLPYVPDGMKAEDLISLQRKGTAAFYLRPGMIYRQLFQIRTLKLEFLLKGLYCLTP